MTTRRHLLIQGAFWLGVYLAVERSLHRLGVPVGDFHSEQFNLV